MAVLTALLAGLVFGLGLILSGMTDPANIQSFLDFSYFRDRLRSQSKRRYSNSFCCSGR